jgi:fructose-bisphosphate aldolase class I
VANTYKPLADHPRVLRMVALSGGYDRDEANTRLAQNTGMIASFSRALTEGLSAQQDQGAFDATLNTSVQSIYDASVAG